MGQFAVLLKPLSKGRKNIRSKHCENAQDSQISNGRQAV